MQHHYITSYIVLQEIIKAAVGHACPDRGERIVSRSWVFFFLEIASFLDESDYLLTAVLPSPQNLELVSLYIHRRRKNIQKASTHTGQARVVTIKYKIALMA